jgi:hypothetical protein
MRLSPSLLAVVLLLSCIVPAANGQEPLQSPSLPNYNNQPEISSNGPLDSPGEPIALGQQHYLNIKPQLGWPTGIRIQGTVLERPNGSLVVEGLLGVDVMPGPFFVIGFPVYGLGCRLMYTKKVTGHDVFQLNPALELYAAGADSLRYFLGPDIELCWLHDFADHFGMEIGLDLGITAGIGGRMDHLAPGSPGALPILALFSGFRF